MGRVQRAEYDGIAVLGPCGGVRIPRGVRRYTRVSVRIAALKWSCAVQEEVRSPPGDYEF